MPCLLQLAFTEFPSWNPTHRFTPSLRLDHPNVVTLFEIFEDSDTLSLAEAPEKLKSIRLTPIQDTGYDFRIFKMILCLLACACLCLPAASRFIGSHVVRSSLFCKTLGVKSQHWGAWAVQRRRAWRIWREAKHLTFLISHSRVHEV